MSTEKAAAKRVDLAELERLSAAATPGKWFGPSKPHDSFPWMHAYAEDGKHLTNPNRPKDEITASNEFAIALVNAYRSGHLVPASLPSALGSGEGTAGATPMWSGSRPSDQAASHPTPAGFDPSRGELLAALEPFARAARGIPSDLPDSLWTSCNSYPWHMPQDAYEAMKADGIPLLDRSTNLSLWIDGHPLSDFRRAADVYARLAAQGTEAGTAETGTGSVHEGPVSEADAPHPQSPSLSKVEGPYRTGRKVRRNVYRFDEPVFMAGSESEAVWLVAVLNAGEAVLRPSPTLTASQEQDGEVRR